MRAALGVFVAALGASAGGCSSDNGPASPAMPGDSATQALNGQLTVPAGFKVAYFATHLPGVRFMALGADGAVYASQPSAGRVVRIWDVNGDGVADSVATAVGGLDRPHGLAFHGGFLYIANTGSVVRVRLGGDGRAAGAPEALVQFDGGGMHWTRSLAFGADSMMYVAMGSTCNVCVETDPMRAAVTRYDANGENGSRFAYGLRNAVGIAVNPATKAIWVSQNERDNLAPDHENLPPDEINILLEGGDYGWPYCYTHGGAPVPNPEYHDASRCTATIPATLEIQAHSAPLGMTFLDRATAFPDDYRGDLLAALHGSWNRGVPTGAKVVRIHVTNGIPVSAEDFVSGWQRADGSRWGRPADVMVYRDGSVLVSDDQGGAIFRVYR